MIVGVFLEDRRYQKFQNSHLGMSVNPKDSRYCGVLDPSEKANVTTLNGRLFIKYVTQGESNKRVGPFLFTL